MWNNVMLNKKCEKKLIYRNPIRTFSDCSRDASSFLLIYLFVFTSWSPLATLGKKLLWANYKLRWMNVEN